MDHCALVRIVFIQIAKGTLKQTKDFRFVMFGFGADFNQFHEIRRRLRPSMIISNPWEWVNHGDLAQGMQIRFAASCNRYIRFEK